MAEGQTHRLNYVLDDGEIKAFERLEQMEPFVSVKSSRRGITRYALLYLLKHFSVDEELEALRNQQI